MASARRAIHEKIIDILKTITVANGYHQDVTGVSKRLKDIESVASFPALSVIEGEQVYQPSTEDDVLYETTVSFSIIGYVKSENDTADAGILSSASDDLIEDIKLALLENAEALFSLTEAKELRFTSDEPVLDYENNWGYVSVNFIVTYYWGNGD